jgi:hypothetical protein
MGSGWRSGGQHSKANYCHRAVIYPSRPSRHGSSCPTGASTPEVTKAWLVGLGRSPVRAERRITQITSSRRLHGKHRSIKWDSILRELQKFAERPYDVPGCGLARLCEVRRRRGGFTAGTCARMGTLAAACRLTTGDVFRGTGEPPRATASLRWVWARPAWAGRLVHQRFAAAGDGSWRQHED